MIPLITILSGEGLFPPGRGPSEAIIKSNVDNASANPHLEAVWRRLWENESASTPDDLLGMFLRMALKGGKAATDNIAFFNAPKKVKGAAEESIDTGIDALFTGLALVMRNAAYENILDIYGKITSGEIKTSGGLPTLAENATAKDAFDAILDTFTSQQFFRTVDSVEYKGRSPDMLGKEAKLGFGIFLAPHRTDAKKAAERKAAAKAAAAAIPVTVAVTAPAPDAE
jgi:hypothetical protein